MTITGTRLCGGTPRGSACALHGISYWQQARRRSALSASPVGVSHGRRSCVSHIGVVSATMGRRPPRE